MRKLIFYLLISLLATTAIIPVALAQTKSVSGTVKDEKGNPLTGATVTVNNTKISATTGADGSFKIAVPSNAKTGEVSYVGMQTEGISLTGTGPLQMVLKISSSILGDVVVVGYSTAKTQDMNGCVSRLMGSAI